MNVDNAAQRAQALVRVRNHQPGGPWFVELTGALQQAVSLGPYENPAIARTHAQRIEQFLAALLRQQQH